MGRTKTMHVAPHVSQVIAPRLHGLVTGGAVVAAVMAPVEGKNAKMTKSLSGSRTGPGAFSRLL